MSSRAPRIPPHVRFKDEAEVSEASEDPDAVRRLHVVRKGHSPVIERRSVMFFKLFIRRHERGLHFRNGDFQRLLPAGEYRLWSKLWAPGRDRVEVVDSLDVKFQHPLLDLLVADGTIRSAIEVVDLADGQRALVWKDDRLFEIVGPGRHAYWKTPHKLKVEVFDVESFRFEHPKLAAILQHKDALRFFDGVQVDSGEEVLLFRDGVLVETLPRGLHVFWKGAGKLAWKKIDRREQVADVAGQEIMTGDRVTLRVNLLVAYQVADPVKMATAVVDAAQALYREAQLALRAAVGARTLDALLADKEAIGSEVRSALSVRAEEFGVVVRGVGLRDIILPGDMKTLLNQVIAAQKEAEANLIKRREETASVRSQANTAKLLADNPQLARLKELEALQSILAGTKATFVFGQGDLAEQVRSLVGADPR